MPYLLCRNRVREVAAWRTVFASHKAAHQAVGLELISIWPSQDDANTLFFLFRVDTMSDAMAFIANPDAAQAGLDAGVLDGEYHFLQEGFGY